MPWPCHAGRVARARNLPRPLPPAARPVPAGCPRPGARCLIPCLKRSHIGPHRPLRRSLSQRTNRPDCRPFKPSTGAGALASHARGRWSRPSPVHHMSRRASLRLTSAHAQDSWIVGSAVEPANDRVGQLGCHWVPKLPWFPSESRGIAGCQAQTRTHAFAGNIRA
jgi:hypothetical protein